MRLSFDRDHGKGEFFVVEKDVQGVIEPTTNDDRATRRRQWRVGLFQLNELSVERNGVIVVDTPGGFKAEDVVKVKTVRRSMDVSESVRASKAAVVFVEIDVFKKVIGSLDGADGMSAKRFDKSVLMSTIGSFDTSFGLWRMSNDHANT